MVPPGKMFSSLARRPLHAKFTEVNIRISSGASEEPFEKFTFVSADGIVDLFGCTAGMVRGTLDILLVSGD